MQTRANQGEVRFPDWLKVRAPANFDRALAAAARRTHTNSMSEYVRRALVAAMRRDGVYLRDGVIRLAGEDRP